MLTPMTDESSESRQAQESDELQRLHHEINNLYHTIQRMERSRSWRWTLPLRVGQRAVRRFLRTAGLKPMAGRVLYIDSRLPLTDRDSGSVRLFEMLRLLAGACADVTFIPFDQEDHPQASAAVRALGIRVLCGADIDSIRAHLEAEGRAYDAVIACRMPFARQYIEDVRRYAPGARIVFDTVDLHFLRLERQASLENNDFLQKEAALWRERELELMRETDCTIVVSEAERAMLRAIAPEVPVFLISNIHRVLAEPVWTAERRNIVYLGNFHHEPNVDAVRRLVRDILPLIREELPDITVDVIGDYPPGTIEDLAGQRVILHGQTADLAPLFRHAVVLAAPLRYGAGVKGKLHMSLAYGVPVVTSTIGAEGMHLRQGESALIADEPAAFAEAVIRLYRDRALWDAMAAAGQTVLRTHFSPETARAEMRRMFTFLDRR